MSRRIPETPDVFRVNTADQDGEGVFFGALMHLNTRIHALSHTLLIVAYLPK
jgi:hypothetical protein